jgi:hypothetical protein
VLGSTQPAPLLVLARFGANTQLTKNQEPWGNTLLAQRYPLPGNSYFWRTATSAPAKPAVLSRHNAAFLSFTGTITDIDYSNREVTLQDPQGRIETFVVDKRVQRLNEAKVGDKVTVDYYLGFDAEVRKPTAEEEQNPLVVLKTASKAGPEANPAASGVRRIRAAVTIEGLDRRAETVTVKGPQGRYYVARVADPSRLEQVHIGETIVMTFTEAAAVSLNPARDVAPN